MVSARAQPNYPTTSSSELSVETMPPSAGSQGPQAVRPPGIERVAGQLTIRNPEILDLHPLALVSAASCLAFVAVLPAVPGVAPNALSINTC